MPRRKATPTPAVPQPGYGFSDALARTGATQSNLQHWVREGVIKASIAEAGGRGRRRRFSALNVVEIQLAVAVNAFGVPVATIREAVRSFREFHMAAVALHDELQAIDTEQPVAIRPADLALFPTVDARRDAANAHWKMLKRWHPPASDTRTYMGQTALEKAHAISDAWHYIRTGGEKAALEWQRFLGLFIPKDLPGLDDDDVIIVLVRLDPDPYDLQMVVGKSAIVIELTEVVREVHNHCKSRGLELGEW